MGRYVAEYTIGQPDDFIRLVSEDYFQKEGFKLVPYKGEMLWKKGRGVLTAPQYIKLAYGQGIVHVEAFIRWDHPAGCIRGRNGAGQRVRGGHSQKHADGQGKHPAAAAQPADAGRRACGRPDACSGAGGCSPAYARAGSADPCRAPHAGRVSGSAGSICGGARLHGGPGSGGGAQSPPERRPWPWCSAC